MGNNTGNPSRRTILKNTAVAALSSSLLSDSVGAEDTINSKWKIDFGHPKITNANLHKSDLYIGNKSKVSVIDEQNGEIDKTIRIGGSVIQSQPVIVNNNMYVINKGSVISYDIINDYTNWSIKTSNPTNNIILGDNAVVVGQQKMLSGDHTTPAVDRDVISGNVLALDKDTGEKLWKVDVRPDIANNGLKISKSGVIIAETSGIISKISMTGDSIWETNLDGAINNGLEMDSSSIYISDSSKKAYSIDEKDGSIQWTENIGKPVINNTPKLIDSKVLFPTMNGVHSVRRRSGKKIWQQEDVGIANTPLVINDKVYTSNQEGQIYKLNDNGRIDWKEELQQVTYRFGKQGVRYNSLKGVPEFSDSNLYVTHSGGQLYAISPGGGK